MTAPTSPLLHRDDRVACSGLVGWGGWGGSMSLFSPEKEVAVSHTMNAMSNNLLGSPRTRSILLELQKVL